MFISLKRNSPVKFLLTILGLAWVALVAASVSQAQNTLSFAPTDQTFVIGKTNSATLVDIDLDDYLDAVMANRYQHQYWFNEGDVELADLNDDGFLNAFVANRQDRATGDVSVSGCGLCRATDHRC